MAVDTSYAKMPPLGPKDRIAGFVAAGLAVVMGVVMWAPKLGEKPAHGAAPGVELAMALLGAFVLAWASLTKKRLFLGLGALFVGTYGPWGSKPFIYGIPFMALAAWEMVRWSRLAGLRLDARHALAQQEKAKAGGRPASSGGGRRSRRGAAPKGPVASKRYTPPQRHPKRSSAANRNPK